MIEMHTYEEWTRNEIIRLRADAQKASAEADTLQRTFDKWLESQGRKNEPPVQRKAAANGHAPARRGRRPGYGNKNAEALKRIKAAAPRALPTDELFSAFTEIFGEKYKRSSMRALLWNQKKLKTIEMRNGRYVIAAKGQHA